MDKKKIDEIQCLYDNIRFLTEGSFSCNLCNKITGDHDCNGCPIYAWGFSDDTEPAKDLVKDKTDRSIDNILMWYCRDCSCNDNCEHKCLFRTQFKKYLEGDYEALTPKFEFDRWKFNRFRKNFIEESLKWLEEYVWPMTGVDHSQLSTEYKKALEDIL